MQRDRTGKIRLWFWRVGFFDGSEDCTYTVRIVTVGGKKWTPLIWRFWWWDNYDTWKKKLR